MQKTIEAAGLAADDTGKVRADIVATRLAFEMASRTMF
jgi:hypothetical protein